MTSGYISTVKMASIDIEKLITVLSYDPETGMMRWVARTPNTFNADKMLTPEHMANAWNSKYAGRQAFTYLGADGYLQGSVFGVPFRAQRVAWAVYHGWWPNGFIDHINGVRHDNRASNLRDVDKIGNARNMGISRSNSSGCTGVFWNSNVGKWHARFTANRRAHHVGFFSTVEDAAHAIKLARAGFGFHQNHGRGGI